MAIGTAAVTPLELARAYTTFATLGTTVQPRWIERVEDAAGNVVWEPGVKKVSVLDRGVAYLVTDMLRDAVNRGTGTGVRRAGFTGPAAGKTGTTNDATDVWFVGYTPDMAAPVWGRMMRRIYSTRPLPKAWARPESVVKRRVDPGSGLLLPDGCRPRRGTAQEELFVNYAQPASTCPRGKPDHEPNIFDCAAAWLRVAWRDVGEWIGSHFGREKETPRPAHEPYLGVPRLPEATEIVVPELDSGIVEPQLDTTEIFMPRIDPETIWTDTLPDTVSVDTLRLDTLRQDSLRSSLRN